MDIMVVSVATSGYKCGRSNHKKEITVIGVTIPG